MFPKSIRWRIQAWHGFLLVCLVGALLVAFYHYERAQRLSAIDTRLQATLTPLLPAIGGRPPGGGSENEKRRPSRPAMEDEAEQPNDQPTKSRTRGDVSRMPDSIKTGELYYVSQTPDGTVRSQSTNAPSIPALSEGDRKAQKPIRTRGEFREAMHYAPDGGCLFVGTSLAALNAYLHRLALILSAIGLAIVTFGVVVGWWAAGRALRPIAQISAASEKIAAGNISERIHISETQSELGKLAGVLNGTFDKLEKSFEQQLRFTADASHELRTPVTVMLTQIQLALSRERTPEEYRQTLQTCERAAERMRALVNQLLELARADSGDIELIREECDLARVARESLEFIEPLANTKEVILRHTLESVKINADAQKLGQVLVNLLNNAIYHNPPGIQVSLTLKKNATHAILRVTDKGVGIPQDALPQLFDRFYRLEKSRTRMKGSSGLGLAICKAIVEAHGGTIRAESIVKKGSAFTVELPLS